MTPGFWNLTATTWPILFLSYIIPIAIKKIVAIRTWHIAWNNSIANTYTVLFPGKILHFCICIHSLQQSCEIGIVIITTFLTDEKMDDVRTKELAQVIKTESD